MVRVLFPQRCGGTIHNVGHTHNCLLYTSSCGVKEIYDGTFSGTKIPGQGVFAKMLMDEGVRVLEMCIRDRFKQAVNLSKQARAIEATLGDITPFNAGKKKEEALSLLKKWFPQMENFSGQLKKYKVTISDLLAENEQLEAKAKASEKGKMKDTMERAKLKSELDNLQRLVDRIPPDILAELKRQQRHTVKER